MKAFKIGRYGKKERGAIGEMANPIVGDYDVLVEVHAAGVNLLDAKIRDGDFKLVLPYHFPLVLGNDVAGIVTQVGNRVQQFKIGDKVYARPPQDRIGSFAEWIAVREDALAIMPRDLSMEEAASLPLVALTAWQALVVKANLKKGQKVLIHAGSGGVGTIAIQLAKFLGATVATTTSTSNIGLVKSLGADVVIDYTTTDFASVLNDYDVVLNSLGSDTLSRSLKVLKPGGQLISISGPPDANFAQEQGLNWFLKLFMNLLSYGIRRKAKRHHVRYDFLFMTANGTQLREITSLVDKGKIRPLVEKIFPFDSTDQALAYVETGRAKGKVVVKIR